MVVLENLKNKLSQTKSKEERILLLSLAPRFWSRTNLIEKLGCTEWEARKILTEAEDGSILTVPLKKKGKELPNETENLVQKFYERDDISKLLPGMKDFISIKQITGERLHVQKRLLLGNLNEIYILFKNEYQNVKIGYTKFTQLKPPNCVLAGTSGTHNVCVCVHHENLKLMLDAINLKHLTKDSGSPLQNYKDCINKIVCSQPSDKCFLGDCLNCAANFSNLQEIITEGFKNHGIHEIKYESWKQTDRCSITFETIKVFNFLEILKDKLLKLKTHDFFAKQQALFVRNLKENLKEGEIVICFDFAENYAFVVQNSAQSFHWNNNQATIFTVTAYYRKNNELKHKSLAIISDNLNHDTVSVYEYQKIVINYLKSHHQLKKVYYVTDGAAQHFKNKSNFHNLLFHEKDFKIKAEWHFFATAHGKSGCDGIGANIKRGARRASLQLTGAHKILTAYDLYNWAQKYCKETKIFYSSKEVYEKNSLELKARFDEAKTIPGTLKYHAFIPIDNKTLKLQKTSLASEYDLFPKLKKTKIDKKT